MTLTRRHTLTILAAFPAQAIVTPVFAQSRDVWTVAEAFDALLQDRIRLLDIRTPKEWQQTGVAKGAWPVSLNDKGFSERLFAARELAEHRAVALICATGGRSGSVMSSLREAGYDGFIDVSEGMLGSRKGPGWVESGLPIVSAQNAIDALPSSLKL
ncbi:molybdopterin biosynthesis protein MoeB [Nereida ignava]|uniref:Molybdopterin biosynthesis protein MoeB n=1 Tax=Nereida ignava TaxID=282199 RepID=A0A0U1NJA9_9RHOB|nr:rhodanese-like domain-containing protein [Nereida ignava]CRK74785.1 molybdopterin biosynthesis protein MoeB [Nereida ignava]SFJ87227.1 Rhodanese-related sulfurtransferase [Nereida ignava DSM 16309]